MTEHSLWRFSRALHRAINERQHEELEALIDDDVDWAVYGPIDMFPFFGARRGKAAVLEVIRRVADNIRVHRFDRESIMLGADSAASMMRYSLTMLDANKPISLRLAQFALQGRQARQHPHPGRYVRPGGAGAGPSHSSAADRLLRLTFANMPAAPGCKCYNRTTGWSCGGLACTPHFGNEALPSFGWVAGRSDDFQVWIRLGRFSFAGRR